MSSFPTNNDLNPDGPPAPDPNKIKEEKAKVLIDQIVSDRLKPIEAQLSELPGLIQNTVVDVIRQLQQQPQQAATPQAQPQQANKTEQLAALGEIAKGLAPLFGKGGDSNQNNQLQDMIMNSFAKMIQAKVDETVMSTYGKPLPPPSWVTDRQPQVRPKIEVE